MPKLFIIIMLGSQSDRERGTRETVEALIVKGDHSAPFLIALTKEWKVGVLLTDMDGERRSRRELKIDIGATTAI